MSRYAAALGYGLTLVALTFFAQHLWLERAALEDILLASSRQIGAFTASALMFAAIYPLTALVSARMLRDLGHPLRVSTLIGVLCVSQLARYIPGNVGQHIARGSMLSARGVPMPALVASLGYEALLAFLAAATIATITFLLWEGVSGHAYAIVVAVVLALIFAGSILFLPQVVAYLPERRVRRLFDALRGVSRGTQLICLAAYVANCWLVGLGLALIAWTLPGIAATGLMHYVGAFAVAWTAGFLIPGLPAGLGMRESVLIVLLTPSLGLSSAVALATLHRLSTTGGDLLAAAIGSVLLWRERANTLSKKMRGDSADES